MALSTKPSSSVAPLDKTPWKMKVQLMRMWKWNEGRNKQAANSIEVVLLESSETRIQTKRKEDFSKWIKDISDEKIDEGDADIDIPKDVLGIEPRDPIKRIVKEVYGDSFDEPVFCHDRAILCHRDVDVDQINDYMLSLLPGEDKICYSDDCLPPVDGNKSPSPSDYMLISPTVFGSVLLPGLPQQVLRLKVGAPIMLLTDIEPSRGLYAGTRLQITMLGDSIIEARRATYTKYDKKLDRVLIHKAHMYPTESLPGSVRRTQFPITLAFAMTVNKSQGQTFNKVGLYLPRRVCSRELEYVAISKVKAKTGFKVLITDEGEKPHEQVVFGKFFRNDVVWEKNV